MTISPARLAANQANAAKSTGPRTRAGKARSRTNAVKHGLRALVVPVVDAATLHTRTVGVIESLRPQNEYQGWMCGRIARSMILLDRLAILERQTRDNAAHRAEFHWEEDQWREANRTAARLHRDPSRTVGQLQRSVAGCDWLITRWADLAHQADRQPWTEAQQTLAHDLLATPPEFRADPPTHQVDAYGQVVVPELTEADLAHAQLAELRELRAAISDADETAQTLAMADLNDFGNRDIGRIQRHERALLSDLNQAIAQSQYESPHPRGTTRFLKSIPAQFFETSAAPAPNEPKPTVPAAPNEPRPEPILIANEPKPRAPIAPNEPIITANEPRPRAPISPNEPIITANEPKPRAPIAPNEPRLSTPIASNKPRFAPVPWEPEASAGLSPELLAIIEEGLPHPDSLDPAWCHAFVAARLGIDPSRLNDGPPEPRPPAGLTPG